MANIADVYARFLASRHPNSMLAKNQRITALTDPKSGELLLSSPRNTPVGSFGTQSMANQMSKGLISGGDFADAIPVPPVPSAHALRPGNAPVEALARSQRVPMPSTLPERRQVPRHVPFRPRTLPTNPNLMPTVLDSGRVGVRDLGGGTPISDPMDPGTTLPKAVNIPSIQTPTREQLGVGKLEAPMSTSQKLRSFASSPYGREFVESLSKASQHFAAGDSSGAVSALTAGANLATEAQDLADEEQEQEALRLSRAGMSMKELAESYASKGDWDTASKIQNYNVTGEAEDRKNTAYSQIAEINKSINERPDMPVEEKMGLLEQQLRIATAAGFGGAVLQSLNQTLERLMGPTAEVPEEEIWYDGITPVRVITQPDGSTLKVDSLGNRSPVDISTLSKSRIDSEDGEVSRGTAAERQNLLLLKPALDSMDKLSEVNDNGVRQDFIMTGATLKNIAALEEEPEYQALLESEVAAQEAYDRAVLELNRTQGRDELLVFEKAQKELWDIEDRLLSAQYNDPGFDKSTMTAFVAELLNQNQGQSAGAILRGARTVAQLIFNKSGAELGDLSQNEFQQQMAGYVNAMNYINPIVRFLSGAQMTNQEAMRYYIALVPIPGESNNVTTLKHRKRAILASAMGGEGVSNAERRAALRRLGIPWSEIDRAEQRSLELDPDGDPGAISPLAYSEEVWGTGLERELDYQDWVMSLVDTAVGSSPDDDTEVLLKEVIPTTNPFEVGTS